MNFLLVAMVVLIWFLMSHHSLFMHAPEVSRAALVHETVGIDCFLVRVGYQLACLGARNTGDGGTVAGSIG
jgi:hypothetical protein